MNLNPAANVGFFNKKAQIRNYILEQKGYGTFLF